MSVTKDELIEALAKLDKNNAQHWTDDGSPRISVIRAITKDDTITRQDVNEAIPGFARNPAPTAEVTAEAGAGDQPEHTGATGPASAPNPDDPEQALLQTDADYDPLAEETNSSGKPLTKDEVKDIMQRRVVAAEDCIMKCQIDIRNANAALIVAQRKATKARNDLSRRFPPLTAAQNVKQHLARLNGLVEDGEVSQIDTAMQNSRRTGWKRPEFFTK